MPRPALSLLFFLNLTAGEFFALFGALGAVITALYLLDRAKQKKIVSTLRFWTAALKVEEQQTRKRMRQPWSLVLQLVSLLMLLLSIAELQWGLRERTGRDHVLLIDTSSWTAQRSSQGILLDKEKRIAERYLANLAASDRVMLVRANGLATPVTSFTSDRAAVRNGLLQSSPGFSALNIDQALFFARHAQTWSEGKPGEIVYIGPRLIADDESAARALPNLRIIPVEASREHCGIRRVGVKRSEEDANSWQAIVTVKNYGSQPRTVHVSAQFAGTVFTPRVLKLEPGEETGVEYNFTTNTAGQLIAELKPFDGLESDHRAVLDLPRTGTLKLAVFTTRPDVLKPLLESNHQLDVEFFTPADYKVKPAADVMLLDQITPEEQPTIASLWIGPYTERSPLPVKAVVNGAAVKTWHSETALVAGLHSRGADIPKAEVFQTFDSDIPVATVAEGPVVVARPANESRPKMSVIGFDPFDGQLKFEVTTPLLFANLLRWLSPDALRMLDVSAAPVGAAVVALDPGERPSAAPQTQLERLRVVDTGGAALPFTIRDQTVQLFVSRPSIVHITSGDRERVLSLTLPDVAAFEWRPNGNAASGLPSPRPFTPQAVDLWKWLALLGGFSLLTEWILFGGAYKIKSRRQTSASRPLKTPGRETELVSK
jgi:Aerotolerance regulator N-terminal/von Willebrand factor type A domain